jgi:hypothetical protein
MARYVIDPSTLLHLVDPRLAAAAQGTVAVASIDDLLTTR